ncbi:benzoate-CoA ligase [Paraburkholderia sp. UCT70]
MEALLETSAREPVAPPPPLFNFARHLFQLNEARASKVAYIDDYGAMTYGELEQRARRCASALRALGVHPEERVLLVMLDTVSLPVAFLGALYAGIVPVVANTLLTAADYTYMLTHSHARAVIVSEPLLPNVTEALSSIDDDGCQPIVSQPHASTEAPLAAPRFETLVDTALPAVKGCASNADDIAFWLYSSGSTGKPKGTVHTHANLYWTAELYAKPVLGIVESDVVFSAAKLFFAYGLGNALTFPLSVGATAILMAERPTAEAIFARLVQHRPTVFYGVPTLYANMLVSPNLPARADVAIRVCASAGEALPRDVGERFTAHFGAEILDGIGSTEMLHIFLSNRAGEVEYGTTGRPVPGYEVELRDEAGRPVPDGEVGDLFIKGAERGADVLEQSRENARDVSRRMDQKRRQISASHERLLRLRGPQRRHAESERPICVAGRGRDGARRASGGARSGGGRRRSWRARENARVRRAQARLHAVRPAR